MQQLHHTPLWGRMPHSNELDLKLTYQIPQHSLHKSSQSPSKRGGLQLDLQHFALRLTQTTMWA
jgi:hypothetical protein